MREQFKALTESTFIPISLMFAITSAVWAVAEWRHDGEENARRIANLEKRVDGLSSMKEDVASIKFKVDLLRVDIRKVR